MNAENPITADETLDSRDIIARLEHLEERNSDEDAEPLFDDELAELEELRELAEQGETLSDWHHGETLIRDDYFETYAQQLADDLGSLSDQWPTAYVDWAAAASALQADYTAIEFGSTTYWARS